MLDLGTPLVGVGPQSAARQAALLFALAGVLALVGTALVQEHPGRLLAIAVADLATAAVTWCLPWPRWGRYTPLALCVPAFVILSFSTWGFGGVAAGTGPFFVLVFGWLGLHFPPWASVAAVPAALAGYLLPLIVTSQPPEVVGSALVLVPIALGIGLLIAHQVGHQRRDRERIAAIERWRAALTASLAHDLRSPLTTVQLALESVRMDGDGMSATQRDQLLATALRQVGRISRLSAGLLDMERVDNLGGLRLDLAQVPVRRAVEDAVELVNSPEVVVEVDPDLTVEVDPERLQQMVINLTTNALRHGRPPVVIRGGMRDGQARIEVRDYGKGVPPEDWDRLFTAFHTGDRWEPRLLGRVPDAARRGRRGAARNRGRAGRGATGDASGSGAPSGGARSGGGPSGGARSGGAPPPAVPVSDMRDTAAADVAGPAGAGPAPGRDGRRHGTGATAVAVQGRRTDQGRDLPSTGLGLWIVDRLARAHGGRVRYEPADPGARMVLTLPLDQPRSERCRADAVASDQR